MLPEADLTPEQVTILVTAYHRWAEAHPQPDTPMFGFQGCNMLTPREIAQALTDSAAGRDNPDGEKLLRQTRRVLADDTLSFDDLIASIDRSREAPDLS